MISDTEKQQIHGAIEKELFRSHNKHGNWDDRTYLIMVWVIIAELFEAFWALIKGDYYGSHGVFAELSQVAACVQKMMCQVIRRELSDEQ